MIDRATDGALHWRVVALVALLALVVSAPTLANGFAYDDRWIIVTNGRLHTLADWHQWWTTAYWPQGVGSLYRPLASTAFALQWVAGSGTPFIFHAVNVVLYVAACVLFARLAALILPATAAAVVAAVFAVHPVHVEAYANAVGQSELAAAVAMFAALIMYIRARRGGAPSPRTVVAITGLYLVGALWKEHAIVLPAWFVAYEVAFARGDAPWRERMRALAPLGVAMFAVAVVVLGARVAVLHQLGGDVPHPVLIGLNPLERVLVMLGVLPDLARLVFVPLKLYADYSPAHVSVSSSADVSQVNGAIILAAALVAFAVAWARSATAAFGALVGALAWLPVSNVAFPSGVLVAERTLFLPTAGALLMCGVAVAWMIARWPAESRVRSGLALAAVAVLVVGEVKSVQRGRVWRSTREVLWTMWREQPLSFKAHYAWGALLFERGDLAGGEREWRMAMRIFPQYHMIYQDLAHRYREHGLCAPAIPLYQTAWRLDGGLQTTLAGLTACQLQLAQFTAARTTARRAVAAGIDTVWFNARIASADSALRALDSVSAPPPGTTR